MLLALYGRLASFDIECRPPRAGVTRATVFTHVHHAIFSMVLTVYGRLIALDT